MVWILCGRTGTRKLVDVEASNIVRIRTAEAMGAAVDQPTVGRV
jgi:hypothetical protein